MGGVPNTRGGPLKVNQHYVNGKKLGTEQEWSETRGDPLIEVVRNRGNRPTIFIYMVGLTPLNPPAI